MKNVLIVDDNDMNRMLLQLLLKDYVEANCKVPLECYEAENGFDAIDKVKEQKFDLICMDIMMPLMDGIEATKKIRQIDSDATIMAVSATRDYNQISRMLSSGAIGFVETPIVPARFLENLQTLLGWE